MTKRVSRLTLIGFSALVLFASLNVQASEEEALAMASFTFQSNGIDLGPVTVTGAQSVAGISALTIKAFGRDFTLTGTQLQQLKGVMVNAVQLSYETGYPKTGGRTVYLQLWTGFTSGMAPGKRVIVKERGDITVEEVKAK